MFDIPGAQPIAEALVSLHLWLGVQASSFYWANDPDFDLAILRDATRRTLVRPDLWRVPYNAGRSLRTISHAAWGEDAAKRGLWPERDPADVAHNALGDARHQARVVIAAMKRIKAGQEALDALRGQR